MEMDIRNIIDNRDNIEENDSTIDYNEIHKKEFIQREYSIHHPTYDRELSFYQKVSEGRVEELKKGEEEYDYTDMVGRGKLSSDDLRNYKYHDIVMIAMISRFCIEAGLEEMESYNLSDYYINALDKADTIEKVRALHSKAVLDYAKRMRENRKRNIFSVYCIKAMDYIYDHLHEKISVSDIAAFIGIDRAYLSKLFHKEVGMTISAYILEKKLKAAENMLLYENYSCTEISEYLSFASGSYFIKCFRERYKMTPNEYRNKNYRKHFSYNSDKKQN